MSLDITLINKTPITKSGTSVFVRDGGKNRELSAKEVAERFEGAEVQTQEYRTNEVYDANITHNLTGMAAKADDQGEE